MGDIAGSLCDCEEVSPDAVHVWTLELDGPSVPVAFAEATLAADERERAGRFFFERDRIRYTLARGGLRLLLGHYLRQAPATIPLIYSSRGKPMLAPGAGSALRFNLSHSGTRVVYAIARDRELGVDIERVRADTDVTQIGRRFFSESERAALMSYGGSSRVLAFHRCWTRKEAYLKGLGEGLTRSLSEFDVSVLPEAHSRVLGSGGEQGLWTLTDIKVTRGYVGALAVEGRPRAIRQWTLGERGACTTPG